MSSKILIISFLIINYFLSAQTTTQLVSSTDNEVVVLSDQKLYSPAFFSEPRGDDDKKYSYINKDPYKFPSVMLSAGVLLGSRPLSRIDLNYTLSAEYMVPHIGSVYSMLIRPFVSDLEEQYDFASRLSNSSNELKPYSNLDIGIKFYLIDKKESGDIPVKVGHSTDYRGSNTVNTTEYFVTVPGEIRKIYALRAGINYFRNTLETRNHEDEMLVAEDGTLLSAWETFDGRNPAGERDYSFHTNVSYSAYYMGVEYTWLRNVSVNVKNKAFGDGPRSARHKKTLYLDLAYAPNIALDDVIIDSPISVHNNGDSLIVQKGEYDIQHDNIGGYQLSNLGLRVGVSISRFHHTSGAGWTLGMEAGRRPGVLNYNTENLQNELLLYFDFKFAFTFGITTNK